MGITQANIWKHGAFRSVITLFSTPTRSIKVVAIPDTGIIGLDTLKLAILPYALKPSLEANRAWVVIQKLFLSMKGCDDLVLPVSERTYVPLDPLKRLTDADRERLTPLDDIATRQYDAAFGRVTSENKRSQNAELLKTVVITCGVVACICIGVVFLRGCGK